MESTKRACQGPPGKRFYFQPDLRSLFNRSSKLLIVAHYGSKGVFLPAAIICPSQFITAAANQEFTVAERQLQRTWAWTWTWIWTPEHFVLILFGNSSICPRLSDRKSYCSTFQNLWILIEVDPEQSES